MLIETVFIPDTALNTALHAACQVPLETPLTTDDLATLSELELTGLQITDLEGMQYCVNLRSLDISSNAITDLTPISGLLSLNSLNIGANFDLTHNAIQKIASLINITELYIDKTQAINFDFVTGMSGLQKLSNTYTSFLVDLKGIEGLTSLTTLLVSRATSLRDISSLSDTPSLMMLDLSYCREISDTSFINQIQSLLRLDMQYANLQDITFTSNLKNIKEVNFGGNFIRDISPLTNLLNLTDVAIQGNYINDLSPLVNLTKINKLYLQENCITSISPLLNLPSLDIFNIENNYLTDLNEIQSLSSSTRDLLFNYNFLPNTKYQKAFSTPSDISLVVNEEQIYIFLLLVTTDGTTYDVMESKNSHGVNGYSVISNNNVIFSASGEGNYVGEVTSINASIRGLSEGTSSLSLLFSYSGSTPVSLPFINGEYQESVTILAS